MLYHFKYNIMKLFVVMALCLTAIVADDFEGRRNFHQLHYSQHQQTVNEAKKNAGVDTLNVGVESTHPASFEEVGTYGTGLTGFSSDGTVGQDVGFVGTANSGFGSVSSCVTNCMQRHSETAGQAFKTRPLIGFQSGGTSGYSENLVHHEESHSQAQQPVVYSMPSGSENYVHIEEKRVTSQPQIQYVVPSGGHESYVKIHKVTTTQSQPVIQTVPVSHGSYRSQYKADFNSGVGSTGQLNSGVSAMDLSSVDHMNSGMMGVTGGSSSLSSTSSSSKTTSTTNHGSQLGSILNGQYAMDNHAGLTQGFNNGVMDTGMFGSSAHTYNSGHRSFGSGSSNLYKYMSEAENLAKMQAKGLSTGSAYNSGMTSSNLVNSGSTMNSGLSSGTGFSGGLSSGLSSSYNSGMSSNFNSGMSSSMNSGLTSSSSYNGALSSSNAMNSGFGASNSHLMNAGLSNSDFGSMGGVGGTGGGFQTKSWEKSSKWSSQSGMGTDGKVNNYNELTTGESEHYDNNGKRTGYNAATSSINDNGKVSSYSLHS